MTSSSVGSSVRSAAAPAVVRPRERSDPTTHALVPQTPGKRFFFLRLAVARLDEPVQAVNISFVAFVSAALVWRFASAVIRARAVLTTEFAPVNHMLMNGFFFNQGLDM